MLRPSRPLLSKSSKAWLSRQNRDPYVRLRSANLPSSASSKGSANPNNSTSTPWSTYRARSAFKLLEIENDKRFGGFLQGGGVYGYGKDGGPVVLDLGAAPGGWSQVVADRLGWGSTNPVSFSPGPTTDAGVFDPLGPDETDPDFLNTRPAGRGTIIAVDLLPMTPIPGVHTIQGNFLSPSTQAKIRNLIPTPPSSPSDGHPLGLVDVILSDMAANATGNNTADTQSSVEICEAVWEFAKSHLRVTSPPSPMEGPSHASRGGVLLIKFFAHPLLDEFRQDILKPNFKTVHYIKPDASRQESREGYFLCKGFRPRT